MPRWDNEPIGPGPSPRPWWADKDKVFRRDIQDQEFAIMYVPISNLTEEEFIKNQELGAIPKDYKQSDWIK